MGPERTEDEARSVEWLFGVFVGDSALVVGKKAQLRGAGVCLWRTVDGGDDGREDSWSQGGEEQYEHADGARSHHRDVWQESERYHCPRLADPQALRGGSRRTRFMPTAQRSSCVGQHSVRMHALFASLS